MILYCICLSLTCLLSLIISGSIHVTRNDTVSFFLWLSNIPFHLVKAMVFPVVMYGHESWTIKKAECWRIDAFELWCWRRLQHMWANLENSAVATGLEKVSFHCNPKERQCEECSQLPHNCITSHASKVMLNILQARLQQYMNHDIPDVQAGFRKGRGTRDQVANICWITEKAREFQKKKLLLYWVHHSLWLYRSQKTVTNSLRDGNTRPPDLPLENLYAGQETWNNGLVPNWERSTSRLHIVMMLI